MTLREFYGWAPTETHRDATGQVVAVVTREPRFDEAEREAWIARWEYEQDLCPDCGNPRSVCSDPNVDNYPQRSVCWVTAAGQVAQRRWAKKHENAKPDREGYLPDDGVRIWMSRTDLTPDDDFLPNAVSEPSSNDGDGDD